MKVHQCKDMVMWSLTVLLNDKRKQKHKIINKSNLFRGSPQNTNVRADNLNS